MIGRGAAGPISSGFADQLRNPHGAAGRLAGAAMRLVNRQPNSLAIHALDLARNRAAVLDGHVQLSRGHFDDTGLADQSVDRILAVNVAYFWSDGPAVLAELDRVLRPGGRISIFVTDASTMSNWAFAASGHHRLFSASQLAELLADGPFDESRISVTQVSLRLGISGLVAVITKACD